MRTIRILFTDFPGPINPDGIRSLLEQHYQLVLDEQNPDYVIYSVFGHRYLNYPRAVRVFFTGENVHPDFNLCDYAFGFDWMLFEDRYCRFPNFLLYEEFQNICEPGFSESIASGGGRRNRFCNFIYSNANAHPFRDQLFHALNEYRSVDSGGKHRNNSRGFNLGKTTQEKLAYQREFRFTIACENSSSPGYTTEKLVQAIAAGTIPIYWGDPVVGRHFNTRRMVNCHEYKSPTEIVARVAEIDRNESLYQSILAEPVFAEPGIPEELRRETPLGRFKWIFDQPLETCRRRNEYVWGRKYEEQRKQEIAALTRKESLLKRTVKGAGRLFRSR